MISDRTSARRTVRALPGRVTGVGNCGQATKGAGWMSWHREATKDVVACDKPGEAGKRASIPGSLNEETRLGEPQSSSGEFIAGRGERGELKHLITRRRRKRHRFRQ